jgi:NAD(P)-dependent dehydrogenase (short-subunit alcohol dehydrogenase family)
MDKSKYIGKVSGHALVLGGSGGIGSEVVRALVAAGASKISFTYLRNEGGAKRLEKELKTRGVKKVFYDKINLSEAKEVEKFLDEAIQVNGEEIRVVVNAVGISPNKPLRKQTLESIGDKMDDKGWREVFEVNVFGGFISTRTIALRMEKKKVKGSIVLVTSTNGINSHSQISAHYDSSKAAQSHMMRNLAEEFAKSGIRINGVAPGWINTEMNQSLPPKERKKEMARIWSGRFAEPHEIAAFIAFISGTGGSYTSGQDFMVDGGYR